MADQGEPTPATEQTATDLEAIKRRLERQNAVLRNRKPVDGSSGDDAIDTGDPIEMNPLTQTSRDET